MHLITTVFSLLFLGNAQARRNIVTTISLTNAGERGNWLKRGFCPEGYIKGFSMKVPTRDDSPSGDVGIVGIRGHCSDGYVIPFNMYWPGTWSEEISCNGGRLKGFSVNMKIPQDAAGDDTTVTNIQIKCQDGTIQKGKPLPWDDYSTWSASMRCTHDKLCGIQIKADDQPHHRRAFLNLTNVKFFCCG